MGFGVISFFIVYIINTNWDARKAAKDNIVMNSHNNNTDITIVSQ